MESKGRFWLLTLSTWLSLPLIKSARRFKRNNTLMPTHLQHTDEDEEEEEEDDAEPINNESLAEAFMLHKGRNDVLAKVRERSVWCCLFDCDSRSSCTCSCLACRVISDL